QTLGLTPQRILRVFLTQGLLIGLAGVASGGVLGVLLASHVEALIAWLEQSLGFRVLAPEVYYISHIPARLEVNDVILTMGFSLLLCLLAPLYPAWLASRVRPAVALRHE
ncbi:MAG: FtsX-like permease family protein, partial [Gammaproteobacteria bacterium]